MSFTQGTNNKFTKKRTDVSTPVIAELSPTTTTTSSATLVADPEDLKIGLEFDTASLAAASTTDVLAKIINQGAVINAISQSSADVTISDFDSTNKKFGAYSYIVGSGNILAYPFWMTARYLGTLSAWYRNLTAGDYIMYAPLLGAEIYLDGSGFQTFKITESTAATESTKNTTTVQGSADRSADSTFHHIACLWRFNSAGGASSDLMKTYYDGVGEGTEVTGDTISVNPGNGGYVFFGAKRNDPTWDHFLANSGLPTAHSDAWTSNGTPNASVSNGILNLNTSAAIGYYTKASATLAGINLASQTIEMKARVNSASQRSAASSPQLFMDIRDDSLDRSVAVQLTATSVSLWNSTAVQIGEAYLDTSKYHIYRLTSSGSPNPTYKLYIDDVLTLTGTDSTSDATANDTVRFGCLTTESVNADIEWIAYADDAQAPVVAGSSGNLDSIGVSSSLVSTDALTSLQTNSVSDVFNSSPSYGPSLPISYVSSRTAATSINSLTFINIVGTNSGSAGYKYYLAGDGVTEFSFKYSIYMSNNLTGAISIIAVDIDGDVLGASTSFSYGFGLVANAGFALGAASVALPTFRNIVLPVGLHTISAVALCTTGSTMVIGPESAIWERSISKSNKLS